MGRGRCLDALGELLANELALLRRAAVEGKRTNGPTEAKRFGLIFEFWGADMKSKEVFEVCHQRYKGLRNFLDGSAGAVKSADLDLPSSGYHWRPNRGKACEYIADFERIGRHGLRRPEWKGRLRLFETYFVNGLEYDRARSAVGVAAGTFDYWYQEVKKTLGAEFSRTGLFPPSKYFHP